MSAKQREQYAAMVRKIGPWVGVRYLRNQGVAFEDAYQIMFNRKPRI